MTELELTQPRPEAPDPTPADSTTTGWDADLATDVAGALTAARQGSLSLLDPLSEADQLRQHSPLMSPLIWDLAHVANYEELWLLRALAGRPAEQPRLDGVYDAFRHPRRTRSQLPILGPADTRAYAARIRTRVLDVLDTIDLETATDPRLLVDGFVYGMVIQHEHQHNETMLATMQLMAAPGYRPAAPLPPPADPRPAGRTDGAEVLVPAGPFLMGTDTDPWALDNERPAHLVALPPFFIDAYPVTNAAYAAFIADGGYQEPRWWSETGWAWRMEAGLEHPQFWRGDGAGWWRDRFGWIEPLALDQPVQHVCWYEADAYARWAGRRLPSEAEWEKAASWAADGHKHRWPWGDDEPIGAQANLGRRHMGPAAVGAYPSGAAGCGAHQLIGDVWEWTASDFDAYPGFASFPYREYSEVFFGPEYKVLRGGSWATDPLAMRSTFRNWDLPIRRQIFAGFRCARDA